MGGRLEHAIRLLPQVVACSTTNEGDIVVLADPSASARTIQSEVERLVRGSGADGFVRVIGPVEPLAVSATRTRSPLATTATIATVAAIGVGTLIGGLTVAGHHATPTPPVQVVVPTPAPVPVVVPSSGSLHTLSGVQGSETRSVVGPPAHPGPSKGLPVEAPDLARAAALAFFNIGPRREARTHRPPRARPTLRRAGTKASPNGRGRGHHQGKHLPTWSEAYLPPHPGNHEGSDPSG